VLASVANQEHAVIRAKQFTHLVGAGEAGFIDEVEVPLLQSGRIRRAGKKPWQGSRLDAGFIQLAGGAGGRGEALDLVAALFGGVTDNGTCGCLSCAGESLNALDAVGRTQNIFDHGLLGAVEMRMLVGNGDSLLPQKNRIRPSNCTLSVASLLC
jgi:hypothetical protein